MSASYGRRDLGQGTTVAVAGKDMVVDAVGMARWPEEGKEGGGTGLSNGGGEKSDPRSKRKPNRGGICQSSEGRQNGQLSPAPLRGQGYETDVVPLDWVG